MPSRRPDDAAATTADCDNKSQPTALLTQEFIAPILPPPPLPLPDNLPELDFDPNLFPNQQDASTSSNRTLTSEAIIANASPTRSAGDVGWEQFFGHKIKFKGEGVHTLRPPHHPILHVQLVNEGAFVAGNHAIPSPR